MSLDFEPLEPPATRPATERSRCRRDAVRPDAEPDEPGAERARASRADAGRAAPDEQVKVIGTLRIGIPLYNVFLNEADE